MSSLRSFLSFGVISALSVLATPADAGRCPNLAIVLDKSGSMTSDLYGNQPQPGVKSRWAIATAALSSVVDKYERELPIGLSLFPNDNSCGAGGFVIPPAYQTGAAIRSAMSRAPQSSALTPTCTAVQSITKEPVMNDSSRGQYVLLLTDGQPNCSSCGATDSVAGTVNAIAAAASQTPSIKTFVVGFGGGLPLQLKQNLDQMARAGQVPNPDPSYDFYPADSEAALLAAIDKIMVTITGGEFGTTFRCDDSCYSLGCPSGEICTQGTCKADPCQGKSCEEGKYCFTSGGEARCESLCPISCGSGARCVLGQCVPDACGVSCGSGQICDSSTKNCVADAACAGVVCKVPQGCRAGKCVDDPCMYVTCPAQYGCVGFEGSCVPLPCPDGPPDLCMPPPPPIVGCQVTVAGTREASSAPILGALTVALLLLRNTWRRNRRK